jgi:F0F1-type ATP synthase delta subunit
MMEEEKKNKSEMLNRLYILNESFDEKLELEKFQRSKDKAILREETQQSIQGVNGKLNKLSSSVYTSLELQKSETKQIQSKMSKKIGDYKNEVETEICNIQSEIVKFRQELIVVLACWKRSWKQR